MNKSNICEDIGWISPNGDYYGISSFEIVYGHIAIADQLYNDNIIPNKYNPDGWMEQHGWIKQHGNKILLPDKIDNDKTITPEQMKILTNLIGEKYMILEFPNQNKFISSDKLENMNEWDLHYEIIN